MPTPHIGVVVKPQGVSMRQSLDKQAQRVMAALKGIWQSAPDIRGKY